MTTRKLRTHGRWTGLTPPCASVPASTGLRRSGHALTAGLVFCFSVPLGAWEVHVVPSQAAAEGHTDRAAPETTSAVFSSLEEARDAVRARLRDEALPEAPVVVHLGPGAYALEETFRLTAEDAGTPARPIIYGGAGAGETILTGGKTVVDFARVTDAAVLDRLDPDAREHVRQADLRAQGITDFGHAVKWGERPELFFGDRPMTLARWPDEGYATIDEVVGGEPQTTHGITGDKVGKFTYEGDRPRRWAGEEEIWLSGYWFWDWADALGKVESIDADQRIVSLAKPYHHYGYRNGQRWFAVNVLAELDRPGEWYVDRTRGLLYFWPPAPVDGGEVVFSVLPTLLALKNVEHVTFEGITFEASRDTAVVFEDCEHVQLAGCIIRNVSTLAVRIQGGRENIVRGCDLYQLGGGAISLSGGDRNTLTPSHHQAVDNHIHHYSRLKATYHPALRLAGVGQRVAHNLIHDAPHMAIGLSGNEHLIEYNEIHTVCMETDDAGAFYMGRDWTQRGNVLRYNYFHDIGRFTGHVGVQSIYLDDWSSGTTIVGNVVVRGGRGVLVGGGRDNTIANNIFVECQPAVHVDSRGLGWAKYYFDGSNTTLVDRLEAVPYRGPIWSAEYPELLTLYDDGPALAKGNVIARNVCAGGRWLDLRDGLTEDIVHVEDNLVDPAPGFVDREKGDYRLRPDSPAFDLGFRRIPFETIGLRRTPGTEEP